MWSLSFTDVPSAMREQSGSLWPLHTLRVVSMEDA